MPSASSLTAFSWGYWGWGSATKEWVSAVDAIERKRGFRPPLFVDIRLHRSVRATGFHGNAFENLVGTRRHRWMPELGNLGVKRGGGIQIAKPEFADELLDLILSAHRDRRRVVYFCGCYFARRNGAISCHRAVVTALLLDAAKRRKRRLTVVEWPGGTPASLKLKVADKTFRAAGKGAVAIPVSAGLSPSQVLGPPWGSIATITCDSGKLYRIIGPLIWKKNAWHLEALAWDDDATPATLRKIAARFLDQFGFLPQDSKTRKPARSKIR